MILFSVGEYMIESDFQVASQEAEPQAQPLGHPLLKLVTLLSNRVGSAAVLSKGACVPFRWLSFTQQTDHKAT